MHFSVHELLIAWYFEEMDREPLDRYSGITLEQVKRCDREVWLRLGKLNQAGFQGRTWPLEDLPLDNHLKQVMVEHRVVSLLNPLPLPSGSRSQHDNGESSKNKRLTNELNQLRSQLKKSKTDSTAPRRKNNDSVNKAGGKGTGKKGRPPPMPRELIGFSSVYEGQKLCFDYNLEKGCTHKGVDGCDRGIHRCMFPGCGDKHSVVSCPMRLVADTVGKKRM